MLAKFGGQLSNVKTAPQHFDPIHRVSRTSAYDWNIYLEPQNAPQDDGKVGAEDQRLVLA